MSKAAMRQSVMLCAVTISAAGGAWAQADDWMRLFDQGNTLERAGSYKEAAAAFESALRIAERFDSTDTRLPITLNKIGITCDELGRFSDAERANPPAIGSSRGRLTPPNAHSPLARLPPRRHGFQRVHARDCARVDAGRP